MKTFNWPILLKNYNHLHVRLGYFVPTQVFGYMPQDRPIKSYVSCGCINFIKSDRFSSNQVDKSLKRILEIKNIKYRGANEIKISGNTFVLLGRAARLVHLQRKETKEFICLCKFHNEINQAFSRIMKCLEIFKGILFYRPPFTTSNKARIRLCCINGSILLKYENRRHRAVLWIRSESITYIRSLCVHLGLVLGVGGHMEKARCIRAGFYYESINKVRITDIIDAMWVFDNNKNEAFLRRVVFPLEILFTYAKRIVVKDTAVNSICFGANIMIPGIIRYENNIDIYDEVVILTMKGEAVGLGVALMSTTTFSGSDFGMVARVRKVIMPRDIYPRSWCLCKMSF